MVSGSRAAAAAADLRELVLSHPDHERVHLQLLDALDDLGDLDGALVESQQWASCDPTMPPRGATLRRFCRADP